MLLLANIKVNQQYFGENFFPLDKVIVNNDFVYGKIFLLTSFAQPKCALWKSCGFDFKIPVVFLPVSDQFQICPGAQILLSNDMKIPELPDTISLAADVAYGDGFGGKAVDYDRAYATA